MIKRTIALIIFNVLFSNLLFCEALSENDIKNLSKQRSIEHLVYEIYMETDDGCASVLGYHFDLFFSRNFFMITEIFGAVGGSRGGYGIAAFGVGYREEIFSRLFFNSRISIGSGGGGGLPVGGGLTFRVQAGLSLEFLDNIFIDFNGGWLSFPTGTYKTPIINFGISYQGFRLFLPYE